MLLVLPLAIAGCKGAGSSGNCHVRLITAVPRRSAVRALIEDHALLGPIGYGQSTNYRSFVSGRYTVRIASDTGPVCSGQIVLTKETNETVIAAPGAGGDGDNHLVVVPLSSRQLDSGASPSVVFVNAVAGGRRVDILLNSVAAAEDVSPGMFSPPVRLGAGAYDLRAIVAGNPAEPVADGALIAGNGSRYVCVLMGGRGEATVIRVYEDR